MSLGYVNNAVVLLKYTYYFSKIAYLPCEALNQLKRLAPLMPHQTHGGLLNDIVEQHQVLMFERLFLGPHKVIPQVIFQLGFLLGDIGEIDEEPRTHVSLQTFDVVWFGRSVLFD